MCDMDSGETCEVWSETWITARKNHRCDSCDKRIRPREKYVRHFSIFEGYISTAKCCAKCKTDRDAFGKVEGHYIPHPSSFVEALDECISDYESTAEEKRKWRAVLRNVERRRANARGVAA